MYPGIPYSPQAFLTAAIGAADTIIPVDKIDAFPPAPNLAVIGSDEGAETIRYAAKTDNALSGCTRGVEGAAQEWQAGEVIARNFTAEDLASLQSNLQQIDSEKVSKVTGAAAGNLAGFGAGGDLTDSGKKPTDFADKAHSHNEYAKKAPSPTAGNLAGLDTQGNVVDSGKNAADFDEAGAAAEVDDKLTSHTGNKANPHGVTAAQVGARPNTWMPTAAQVGARANTWVPTADEVTETSTRKFVSPAEKEKWDNPTTAAFYTVPLPASGWTGTGPYVQTVAVEGILSTDRPIFGAVYSGTNEEKVEQSIMAGFVDECETAAGSVTFRCYLVKPEVDLTMQLEVIR